MLHLPEVMLHNQSWKKCYLPTVYEPDGSNAHFETKRLSRKGEGGMRG